MYYKPISGGISKICYIDHYSRTILTITIIISLVQLQNKHMYNTCLMLALVSHHHFYYDYLILTTCTQNFIYIYLISKKLQQFVHYNLHNGTQVTVTRLHSNRFLNS